jgi:C_GCAxxG_C_C family probable redox protein
VLQSWTNYFQNIQLGGQIMSKADQAMQCFNNGFNCSQAVLSTYSEQFGLDSETAKKISCPFGSGIGRMSETCGAVTGAFMVIGLKYGKYQPEDNEAKEKTFALVKEFTDRFTELHGSISCKELLHNDMKIPEELEKVKELGLWTTLCPVFVKDASRLIEELLEL